MSRQEQIQELLDRRLELKEQLAAIEEEIEAINAEISELTGLMEEEFDYQSISSLGDGTHRNHRRGGRSPSISSTTSSMQSMPMETLASGNCPYLPLVMRFPRSKWQDAVEFYQRHNQ